MKSQAFLFYAAVWAVVMLSVANLLRMKRDTMEKIQEQCRNTATSEKHLCYQAQLATVLKQRGTEQALTLLEQLATHDPDVLREAHPYTHELGRVAFAYYQDAPTAFAHCRDTFASGCYHGVLEGYLSSRSQITPQDVIRLCSHGIQTQRSSFIRHQCVHGLGHGLTMYFHHDVRKALGFCAALPAAVDRESCYGGVFMENIVFFQAASHGGHHHDDQSLLNPQDSLYPCDVVEQRYQGACYLLQGSAILMFTGWDIARAFGECDKAPPEFRALCYQSLGREISGFTRWDGEQTRRLCGLGSRNAQRYCVVGAVKDFVQTYADPQRGFAFCRTLEAADKRDCYVAVGQMVSALLPSPAERKQVCASAEAGYTATCAHAASS